MRSAVEVAAVVDVGGAMDVVAVDLAVIQTTRTLSATTMGILVGDTGLRKMGTRGNLLKGVAIVGLVVHSVVVAVVVLAMERQRKENAPGGCTNAAVVLVVGEYFLMVMES